MVQIFIVMLMIIIITVIIAIGLVIAIATVAEGVEQEHGGSRRLPTTDPDSTAPEPATPVGSDRRRKHTTTGKGEKIELVTCINGMRLHSERKREEERGAQCIMGNPPAV